MTRLSFVTSCSDELEDVFQSMDRLRVEFEELARPGGLPPPGEPLPREDVAIDKVPPRVAMLCFFHQTTWRNARDCVGSCSPRTAIEHLKVQVHASALPST